MAEICGVNKLLGGTEFVCIEPPHDGELHYMVSAEAPIPFAVK